MMAPHGSRKGKLEARKYSEDITVCEYKIESIVFGILKSNKLDHQIGAVENSSSI